MHLLVDSDSLCYRAGFAANGEGQEALANWQLRGLVDKILDDCQPSSYRLYLSGGENFRYAIYPEYKGNRKDMKRPIHLQSMREHLCETYVTTVTDGIEADDAVSIAQVTVPGVTAIAGIDKDLLCIPGKHYNFDKKEWREQSMLDAMRWFFYQCIMGDRADNIPGFDGKMRLNVPKFLQADVNYLYETDNQDEMLDHVFAMYGEDWQRLNLSASCLWLLRKEGDRWTDWQNKELVQSLTEVSGHSVDSIPSSLPLFGPEASDGNPNGQP